LLSSKLGKVLRVDTRGGRFSREIASRKKVESWEQARNRGGASRTHHKKNEKMSGISFLSRGDRGMGDWPRQKRRGVSLNNLEHPSNIYGKAQN